MLITSNPLQKILHSAAYAGEQPAKADIGWAWLVGMRCTAEDASTVSLEAATWAVQPITRFASVLAAAGMGGRRFAYSSSSCTRSWTCCRPSNSAAMASRLAGFAAAAPECGFSTTCAGWQGGDDNRTGDASVKLMTPGAAVEPHRLEAQHIPG